MTSSTLFGKLQEHDIRLERLEKHEDQEKNFKNIALKTRLKHYDSKQDDESQSTSDEDDALVKKFEKFLKKDMAKEMSQKEAPRKKIIDDFSTSVSIMLQ